MKRVSYFLFWEMQHPLERNEAQRCHPCCKIPSSPLRSQRHAPAPGSCKHKAIPGDSPLSAHRATASTTRREGFILCRSCSLQSEQDSRRALFIPRQCLLWSRDNNYGVAVSDDEWLRGMCQCLCGEIRWKSKRACIYSSSPPIPPFPFWIVSQCGLLSWY